jgi:hypothetical protein
MRICAYRNCDLPIDHLRRQAIYCCPSHKAAENRLKKEDGRSGSRGAAKPYKTVRNRPRRANRDGVGTRFYIVDDELALVRDLLNGKQRRSGPVHARLLPKVLAAAERIDGRSAA